MKMKIAALAAAALIAAPLSVSAQMNQPGFYIAAGGGLNHVNFPRTSSEKLGFNITAVVGYDFIGPMVEVEGGYRRNTVASTGLNQWTGMLNALYEFNPESNWRFHLGLGAGVDYLQASSGGLSANATKFAAQALIGMRIGLGDGFFLRTNLYAMNVFVPQKDITNFGGRIMIGYKFGPAMSVAPPPPPPAPSTNYIVFFDFDRANITPQAMTTIKQAAAAATAGKKTRIGVTGHADRSGNDAYNMALSLRRANAVKDALVREGIPAANIAVVGRGESQPLVATADGVREPQNRRVEIVLN
ncbi:MAG: OmpA family protein [Rhodospirillales bacterium]|nr:MAG: OmpA family protein [Rhodospirillales bacterium]